ncbi:unnamed protein product [Mytilus edulis]|uniref:DZIP3-like HEPN domain-containing protein n=1 Tax=Mytilus edulis TaxID=6550 RepID=A0A8S3RBN6_MYTED|nr:unnamed protein product [Mytilus edulis]
MEYQLFEAISEKRYRLARILVEGGVDVNCQNEEGETPLLMVCDGKPGGNTKRMQMDLIRILLNRRANYRKRDRYGRTSLTCAHINKDHHVIQLLENTCSLMMDRDDKRRYFIVGSVVLEVVTPLFRTKLESDYTTKGLASLQAFLNTQPIIHILFHLRHRNARCCVDGQNCCNHPSLPLIYCQWKRLYSEKPGLALHGCHCKFTANPVQLKDLDVTLASLVLLNCCVLTPADAAAIQGLRQYKNDYLSHNTTGRISQTEYKSLWTDLTNFVLQLDPSKQDELVRLEKRPLDEVMCNSYTLNLLDIHKKLDEMDTSIQNIRSDIKGQNAYMQEILLYIRKDRCTSEFGISELQEKDKRSIIKPFKLGQDIFQLNHKINLISEISDGLKGYASDIVMMNDGRLVICFPWQYYNLLICNSEGFQTDSIHVKGGPCYVTPINNLTVAITLMNSECVDIYDINSKLKLQSISVPGMWRWRDITTIDNKLVVCGANSLIIIDYQGEDELKTIVTECRPYRLHCHGDKIFYCDKYFNNNKYLYVYSYADDIHYNLKLPSEPRRMTSLQDGSLYVLCEDSSLQHVSSDGRQYKTVSAKGLNKRCGLAYNTNQRKLVTTTPHWGIFNIFYEK